MREWVRAGLLAGALSGAPSTLAALAAGRDPLDATLAAGSIVLPQERRRAVLVAAAVPVHLGVSLAWAAVLARTLPGRRPVLEGALAGLAICALDLGIVAKKFPAVRALPLAPQVADHVAYGVIVALALDGRR